MAKSGTEVRRPWSRLEVEAVVADYFQMLNLELTGQKYNKTEHRRLLLRRLDDRTEGSVELKHQNISAILVEVGSPWINGYKPMGNYQALLFESVSERLRSDAEFDVVATSAVERPAITPAVIDYSGLVVSAPAVRRIQESRNGTSRRPQVGVKRDYLGLEQRNRALGRAGETFIVQYEQQRLRTLGARKLADRVEHVAQTQGDGLGYDVLSYESSGKERMIEVKTTSFGLEAPFYVSRRELDMSKEQSDAFHLYRLFEFRQQPRMYVLRGPVDRHCVLDPVSYRARF